MKNKRLVIILVLITLLLLLPFIAMQFTDQVSWTLFDFIIAAALLLGTGFLCEMVIRNVKNIRYRIAICVAILTALLILWAELAVGIFTTP